jgi:O-antigen/teichoic acid export membrane protein
VNDSRQQVARHVTQYLFSTIFSQMIGLARSIILPVIFGPVQLGLWNLMNVVVGYGGHAHLGLLHGMNKMIPLLKGQGETEKEVETRDTIFWTNLFIGGVAGCVIVAISHLLLPEYGVYLRIVAAVVFLQQIFNYFSCILRAESRFPLASTGLALFSILTSILVVGMAFALSNRLLGAMLGLLGAFVLSAAYWFWKADYRFAFRLKPAVIGESLIVGLPLIIIGFLDALFLSIDRWIIARFMGVTTVGYYSLAVMASTLLATVPAAVSSVLYPRMLERFAADPEGRTMKGLLVGPLRAVSVMMLVLISSATILLPLVIRLFLPKYTASVPYIEILVPTSFFVSIAAIPGFYLTSVNKQRLQIIVLVIAASLSLVLDLIFVRAGYGAMGVACGTAAGYLVYGMGYTFLSISMALGEKHRIIGLSLRLVVPFLVMFCALAGSRILIGEGTDLTGYLIAAILRLAMVWAALLPALWFTNRDGEVASIVRTVLRSAV